MNHVVEEEESSGCEFSGFIEFLVAAHQDCRDSLDTPRFVEYVVRDVVATI